MIAGGSENALNQTSLHAGLRMNAMAKQGFQNPEESSRPFDEKRCGFVIGEGAGMLVLEDLDYALNRNAPIYAEVVGYSCQSDGVHIT